MRGFHLSSNLVIPLLRGLSHRLAIPHELVPVHFTALVDAHCSPRLGFFFPLPFGRPPSLPHSRIRRTNSFLPHSLVRHSALLRPKMLAALLTSVILFLYKPNDRLIARKKEKLDEAAFPAAFLAGRGIRRAWPLSFEHKQLDV